MVQGFIHQQYHSCIHPSIIAGSSARSHHPSRNSQLQLMRFPTIPGPFRANIGISCDIIGSVGLSFQKSGAPSWEALKEGSSWFILGSLLTAAPYALMFLCGLPVFQSCLQVVLQPYNLNLKPYTPKPSRKSKSKIREHGNTTMRATFGPPATDARSYCEPLSAKPQPLHGGGSEAGTPEFRVLILTSNLRTSLFPLKSGQAACEELREI